MTTPDSGSLDRLTQAERVILSLLAQGHTAKSIATMTGRSIGSVNERLREARRKTGAASSRELARRLAASDPQENRHDLIEMGTAGGATAWRSPAAFRSRRFIRIVAMLAAIALAAYALLPTQTRMPVLPPDQLTDSATAQVYLSPREYRSKFLAERRDPNWAPATETALRDRYGRIAGLARSGAVIRVTCATTLCEVAGRMPIIDRSQSDATMSDLQGAALRDDLSALGMKSDGMSFTSDKADPNTMTFLVYWSRQPASPASTRP